MLATANRFRKKAGFHWGDVLNKRGFTRLGKPRMPIIDARAGEWMAEGYIRLVFGSGDGVGMDPNANRSGASPIGEGVVHRGRGKHA